MADPVNVDLRTIVGTPKGNNPILVQCPCHDDPAASLGVYADHAYCYGRKRYFRRYESAALLLGLWNGCPETALEGVAKVRPLLGKLQTVKPVVSAGKGVKPVDQSLASTFHRYLLSREADLAFFKSWRGFTESTIDELKLGFTGSHFTIPVFGWGGELMGIRYRADPRQFVDGPRYSGLSGHNSAMAYSIKTIRTGAWRELWLMEGEYDAGIGHQMKLPSATITNGAGSLAKLPELIVQAGINPHRWVLATDQDEAGEQAAWELKKQLGSAAVRARWDDRHKDLSALNLAGGSQKDIRLT